MPRYQRTLKDLIAATEPAILGRSKTIPDNFKELSPSEKYKIHQHNRDWITGVYKKDEKLFILEKSVALKRVGKNFFTQSSVTSRIVIEPTKITVKITGGPYNRQNLVYSFLHYLGITTFDDIPEKFIPYLQKSVILKSILIGKVYNQETLCKEIMTKCFRVKDISWKVFRDYLLMDYSPISFFDLKDFTKNLEQSLKVCISHPKDMMIRYDLIMDAMKLDQIVDLTWSEKRVLLEHRKQTELLMAKEVANKEVTEIYPSRLNGDNIRMLNTELEVFKEGSIMHHCLYTNYFDRINARRYLAFHMTLPEECTFSLYKRNDEIYLEQAHTAYNGSVTEETKELIKQFISNNTEGLLELLSNPKERIVPVDHLFDFIQ